MALGWQTVTAIAQQSGGIVDVYGELGVGTTFKVYFPQVKAEGSGIFRSRPQTPPFGTETVLLVEDEAAVRTLTRHVLALRLHRAGGRQRRRSGARLRGAQCKFTCSLPTS